jgi:hypothetical protein
MWWEAPISLFRSEATMKMKEEFLAGIECYELKILRLEPQRGALTSAQGNALGVHFAESQALKGRPNHFRVFWYALTETSAKVRVQPIKPEACHNPSRWLSPARRATPPVNHLLKADPGRGRTILQRSLTGAFSVSILFPGRCPGLGLVRPFGATNFAVA